MPTYREHMDLHDVITYEEAIDVFSYNPRTGHITWRKAVSRKIVIGKIAGNTRPDGYHTIRYHQRTYHAGRLAWLLSHGAWPVGEIDHINRNPSDNRLKNLRVVTGRQNSRNQKVYKNSTTGVAGVSFHSRDKVYQAYIHNNDGKHVHLGSFHTLEDAVVARVKAARKYGYDPKHGR